jgi:hypothetical protein
MKKIILVILFVCFIVAASFAQRKNYHLKTLAFYNLENLYDTIDHPDIFDETSPIMTVKSNKSTVYKQKVNNMAKVLSEIGAKESHNSPTIIGVVEIENRQVLEDLLKTDFLNNKNYGIIHYDSPDRRGIDVALLYQEEHFTPTHHETFELRLWDEDGSRIYTRDQLLVSGYLDNELIHIIVNHWPSRRGGEAQSSPRREKAAFVTTQIIEKIKLTDPDPKVIIMGDFNDDPTNKSFKKVLLAESKKARVTKNGIYNPMEDLFRRGENTLVYRDNINLFDQILVTQPLLALKKDYTSYKFYKAAVYKPAYLTTQQGKYKGYPFRSFASGNFTGGYSDHYPVYIQLIKAD